MRERELKLLRYSGDNNKSTSLPMRERELKPAPVTWHRQGQWSLPMRERELKQGLRIAAAGSRGRSPCGSAN